MSKGHISELTDRAVVIVDGPEARDFLQNVITSDMEALHEGDGGYGALLTPQGKVLFDFLILPDGNRFLLDVPRTLATELVKRLSLYRLRSKVSIALSDTLRIFATWGQRPFVVEGVVAHDPRHPALGFRVASQPDPGADGFEPATVAEYHAHRIRLGVPEGGVDFAYGDAFPHDANMDHLGAVSFAKGCYIGQEVVSRMQHRGTARRRVIQIEGDGPLPPSGTTIEAGGKPIGTVGSVAGRIGLALVRIDRAAAAKSKDMPFTSGGATVRLNPPAWATVAADASDHGDD